MTGLSPSVEAEVRRILRAAARRMQQEGNGARAAIASPAQSNQGVEAPGHDQPTWS